MYQCKRVPGIWYDTKQTTRYVPGTCYTFCQRQIIPGTPRCGDVETLIGQLACSMNTRTYYDVLRAYNNYHKMSKMRSYELICLAGTKQINLNTWYYDYIK